MVADKVRDVMLFTVPGLKDEEDDPIVAPDVPMRDDGADRRFVKAFIHDEIPWMEVSNEVRDLMLLAVPSIDVTADDLLSADEEIPVDGMEAAWFAGTENIGASVTEEVVVEPDAVVQPMEEAPSAENVAAIAAPEATLSIGAPVTVCMLTMPEPIEVPPMAGQAEEPSVEEAVCDAPVAPEIPVEVAEEVLDLTEAPVDDAVTEIPAEASAEEPAAVIEPVEIPLPEAIPEPADMQAPAEPASVEEVPEAPSVDETDIITIPGVRCHPLDPSNDPSCSKSIRDHGIACKTIFDCTVPYDQKARFVRARFMDVDPAHWVKE